MRRDSYGLLCSRLSDFDLLFKVLERAVPACRQNLKKIVCPRVQFASRLQFATAISQNVSAQAQLRSASNGCFKRQPRHHRQQKNEPQRCHSSREGRPTEHGHSHQAAQRPQSIKSLRESKARSLQPHRLGIHVSILQTNPSARHVRGQNVLPLGPGRTASGFATQWSLQDLPCRS